MVSHPSASNEQQEAGVVLVSALADHLRIALDSKVLKFSDGCAVQIDGYSDDPPVLCEAWAHIGKPKGSQPDKVMSDLVKLLFCEERLGKKFRKILLFSDEVVSQHFSGNSWQAMCLRDHGIELMALPLPVDLLNKVSKAQERQHR